MKQFFTIKVKYAEKLKEQASKLIHAPKSTNVNSWSRKQIRKTLVCKTLIVLRF